ncbi:MAG: hypothetical protein LBP95_02105, partial [Deltaproteobacteria bacterium]|nr:hypothetical protein [Deltaproteobacteria bacterium]
VDTIHAAEKLTEIFQNHPWSESARLRPQLTLSIAGCQAGQGLKCGVNEYADIRLIGKRETYPEIDQEIAALSTKISFLISNCPGQALHRSHKAGEVMELDQNNCKRCGWCVSEDTAFTWPVPQKGYFTLEISEHKIISFQKKALLTAVCQNRPNDLHEIGKRLIETVELW